MREILGFLLFSWSFLPTALYRSKFLTALIAAPLYSSAAATTTWLLAMHLDVSPVSLWMALVVLNIALCLHRTPRHHIFNNLRAGATSSEITVLSLLVPTFTFLTTRAPSVAEWDGRYIWLARAELFLNKPETIISVLSADRVWAHPEYPPLIPASVSLIWRLCETNSTQLGLTLLVLLALSASGLATLSFLHILRIYANPFASLVSALGLYLTIIFSADGLIGRGYADTLLCGLLLSAVLKVIEEEMGGERSLFTICVLFYCAAFTKQEALIFAAAALIGLCGFTRTRHLFAAATSAVSPFVLWLVVRHQWAIPNNSDARGAHNRLVELFSFDSEAWRALRALGSSEMRSSIAGLFALQVVALCCSLRRRVRTVAPCHRLAASGISISVIVMLTYALGPTRTEIIWWFEASFSRISAFGLILSLVALTLSICVFLPTSSRPQGQSRSA
jgi:hypothetical protein